MMNYTIEQVSFLSADKTSKVKGWIYTPSDAPRGVIQISHGMCEYIGRYHRFMEDMANKGFVVCGHDHIGHGESSFEEKYGFFGHKDGYKNLVKDLHSMTALVKQKYPTLPYFLFGHSMGSFITRLYLSKYAYELNGVIICGTGGPDPMAKLGIGVCQCVSSVKGPFYRSAALDNMAFGSFNKRFSPSRTSKDWLTRDNKIVDRYLQDSKCMFLFTASGYRDLSKLSVLANSQSWYQSLDKDLPMLLISGDMDPVGNYGKGVQKVFQRLQSTGIKDVSMILYPDARHELLNEINYDEVVQDVYSWIGKHVDVKNQRINDAKFCTL